MKRDPRDLLGEFRAPLPQRPPIVLQRWSIRRVALAAAMLAVITAAVVKQGLRLLPGGPGHRRSPPVSCSGHSMGPQRPGSPVRSGPPPCHRRAPVGLEVIGGADIVSGKVSFWLDSDRACEPAGDHHPGRGLRHRGPLPDTV